MRGNGGCKQPHKNRFDYKLISPMRTVPMLSQTVIAAAEFSLPQGEFMQVLCRTKLFSMLMPFLLGRHIQYGVNFCKNSAKVNGRKEFLPIHSVHLTVCRLPDATLSKEKNTLFRTVSLFPEAVHASVIFATRKTFLPVENRFIPRKLTIF